MKQWITVIFIFFTGFYSKAQGHASWDSATYAYMKGAEMEMMTMADSMINNPEEKIRIRNAYLMIPMLLEILKQPKSFEYPFDSLRAISITYPPDSSFRIFTWQFRMTSNRFRHLGAMQMNTDSLKLHPFFDASEFIRDPSDTITNAKKWYGCIYYNSMMRTAGDTTFYYFFGYDPSGPFSESKLIEVIHFRDGEPIFGAPKFYFEMEDTTYTQNRFIYTYKEEASPSLNYYAERSMIIYDHLVPLNAKSSARMSYVPDGTYEGFEYKNGRWEYVDKVFHEAINQMDNPPIPEPVDFEKEKKIRKKQQDGR